MASKKEIGKCVICDKESTNRCSACCRVFYCSTAHQKEDWKKHKITCHPFKINTSEQFGRYLEASKNIKAGSIVLKETPLIKGPSQITGPVCVGCLEGLEENKCVECETCGWPVCKQQCQSNPDHLAECALTAARGSKVSIQNFVSPHPTYQCLSTVRALLLKEKHPDKWETLLKLESHSEQRRGTDQWRMDRAGIAQFIPRFFKTGDKWNEEEILKVTGILQINGHEVPLSEPPYVAVYSNASLIEHSCIANVTKSFSKNGDIILWTPRDIQSGEHLSISYTDALWGTANRQQHLLQTKMFKCECKRCIDMTELGTNFSALNCNNVKENEPACTGLLLPVSLDKYEEPWVCQKCAHEVNYTYVNNTLERSAKDLEWMKKDNVDDCIKFIEHYSKWLAPNHYRLCEVKLILAQIIGTGAPNAIQKISDSQLQQKLKLAEDLLRLFNIIAPAESRLHGSLRFELHAGLAEIGRRESEKKNPNSRSALEESLHNAEESMRLLKYEPTTLPEGQICAQALTNAHSLRVLLGIATNQ